jgi:hypothetical protein
LDWTGLDWTGWMDGWVGGGRLDETRRDYSNNR